MDFLKKAVDSAKNSSNKTSSTQQQPQQGSEQKQDYGDKAFGFLSKKAGLSLSRDQEEKITDGARGAYEKFTGKKVDPKYSN